ncbi:hypothetical protein ED312_15710 [Sinomicrobium pectinilyticum]|uniref:Toxin-antitoxin system YwqK family antitoxin n=2 Tax=Sinomicrobium pectinilyticum TaxID=1084421 RepID=A0A3N0E5J8_SINP1|nr:hypothetical protein ED312_15710 [Sinomicrobium pectinilyticum]
MLYSCSNKKVECLKDGKGKIIYTLKNGTYHGEYKVYDNTGEIKETHIYKQGRKKDSSVYYTRESNIDYIDYYRDEDSIWRKNFHKNGKIKSEGKIIHEGFPIGEWKYYNEEGVLQEIKEIKNIGGKPHLNRNWFFDSKGDTIPNKSNYYTIQYDNDTISLDRPIQAVISLKEPLFKDKNSMVMVVVPKDHSKNFNKDFSNIEEVETDTTRNLNIETDIKKAFKMEGNYPWTVIFGRYYDTPGPKKFRGIIVEYYYTENHVPDSLNHNYYEHRSYFEKDVYVKGNTIE